MKTTSGKTREKSAGLKGGRAPKPSSPIAKERLVASSKTSTPRDAGGPIARVIREKSGVSRSKFARFSGFSERALANWESGKQAPDPATTRRLREIERLLDGLSRVMRAEAVPGWLEEPNQGFGGLKPIEVVERGQIDRLWAMIFEVESGMPS